MVNNLDFSWLAYFFVTLMLALRNSISVEGNFVKSMHSSWGSHHTWFSGTGDDATLVLDPNSGCGIQSKRSFLFGSIEMQIKLVPGNSAGTVTAHYLSSSGDRHDEIDFEFLGNKSGQPYIIHTNLFLQGAGGREQQFYPWFDPTADYHNYTIHWNPSHVVWYVDGIPIRVYRNYEREGIPYPSNQAMKVYSSLWNADSWATRGGLEKIDWSNAPFVAKFRHFRARACIYSQLSSDEKSQMDWVRSNHIVYDYCKDFKKYNGLMPGECLKPHY